MFAFALTIVAALAGTSASYAVPATQGIKTTSHRRSLLATLLLPVAFLAGLLLTITNINVTTSTDTPTDTPTAKHRRWGLFALITGAIGALMLLLRLSTTGTDDRVPIERLQTHLDQSRSGAGTKGDGDVHHKEVNYTTPVPVAAPAGT